MFVLEQTAIVL